MQVDTDTGGNTICINWVVMLLHFFFARVCADVSARVRVIQACVRAIQACLQNVGVRAHLYFVGGTGGARILSLATFLYVNKPAFQILLTYVSCFEEFRIPTCMKIIKFRRQSKNLKTVEKYSIISDDDIVVD